MAKFASNDVLDAALAVVADANRMLLLAGQPASYAAAVAGALAEAAMAATDFSLAPGSAGTRRLSVAARTGLVAQAAGTADHVALVDGVGQRLLYVTTCPAQPLLAGSPVQVASWQVEIGAPL
ncbi:hypothetical protein [Sandarakinorhabdus oryzae]|uniref:hypothetical protein n=1 Tax=Sandarakinorhabdus oryzae TaxID=2675220 RepID=UPI0012E15275|nr:hypothetical protein [Sandarakinorhabdus oryzae]